MIHALALLPCAREVWHRVDDVADALPQGSPALEYYLCRTYGLDTPLDEASAAWNWSRVAIIWTNHLPLKYQAVAATVNMYGNMHDIDNYSPSGDKYPGLLFHARPEWPNPPHALWVYQYRSLCPHCLHAEGGTRGPPRIDPVGGWVEVAHTINPVSTPVELLNVPMEQMGLWLYTAPGSGLWYHTGRTLTVADVGDLHCLDLASELDVSGAAAFANGTAGGTATREPTHRAPRPVLGLSPRVPGRPRGGGALGRRHRPRVLHADVLQAQGGGLHVPPVRQAAGV